MALTRVPYSMVLGAPVNVLDFGADPTGAVDSAPAIQAAMTYGWQNGKVVYVPAGNYLINSYSSTYDGRNIALFINNGTAGPYQYKPFILHGAGRWATKFTVTNNVSIDCVLGIVLNGESGAISDIGISCEPAASVFAGFYLTGAGPNTIERCWSSGADNGYFQDGGAIEYRSCVAEFCAAYGFYVLNAFNSILDECTALTSTTAGLIVAADGTAAQEPYQSLAGIVISNCTFQQQVAIAGIGAVFDIDQYTDTNVSITNTVFGNNGFSTGGGGQPNNQYGIVIQKCANISFTNCQFPLNKFGNIVQNARNVMFTDCTFSKTGFLLTAATGTVWECSDLAINTTGGANPTNVQIVGCEFLDSSGYAIYATSYNSISIVGTTFSNCANGGLDTVGARVNLTNATVGDSYIKLVPSSTTSTFKMAGNHIINNASYVAGRYGIRLDASVAVPAAGNVKLVGTTLDGALGTNYSVSTATTLQANAWQIFNDSLATSTPQNFPTSTDANAPNSTLYYSSTASRLVWKDSGGAVNNLY